MIIAKNSTQQTITIQISANKTVDVGTFDKVNLLIYFSRPELSNSQDLMNKIKDGFIVINDGGKDLSWIEAIDNIKDYRDKNEKDVMGKLIVRTDSKRENYDIHFTGAGDDLVNRTIGTGAPICFCFDPEGSCASTVVSAPTGFIRRRLDFQFIDGVYLKDGRFKYHHALEGTYLDMYLVCPQGYYYDKKWVNENGDISWTYHEATEDIVFAHWVNRYFIQGESGFETLSTETSSDILAPEYLIWRIEVTIPNTETTDHLHVNTVFQTYRARTIAWPEE